MSADQLPRASVLITRRSQVQILPPPPSKEPAQRPFPGSREGPLTLFGARSAEREQNANTIDSEHD
jgi:hypothetical protein